MSDWFVSEIVVKFFDKSAWELLAVFLGLLYLVFVIKEKIWCWPAAFISTAIYTALFWHVSLLMDSLLNVYYMAMAVYGFWCWTSGHKKKSQKIQQWAMQTHIKCVLAIIVMSFVSGYLLQEYTRAAWPYLDSFTTWASVFTTYLVAKKVLENWLYWLVIDALSIFLYIERGLYPTALLFLLYLILCVVGYVSWRKELSDNNNSGGLSYAQSGT